MHLTRIARTATFRLAALYALVFGASVLALGAVVYWVTAGALQRQFNRQIEVESAALAAEFRSGGLKELQSDLLTRQSGPTRGLFQYRLTSGGRPPLTNSIDASIATVPGWQTADTGAGDGPRNSSLRILTVRLDDQSTLSVARSQSTVRDVERVVFEVIGWAFSATALLGLAGGLFVSSRFLSRVDSITTTAQSIIDGNLRQRIEVRATDDDLDRLSQTLNAMLDRIGELMDRLRQASNDIAHDLRTPLSRMRQRLEAALATAETADQLRDSISKAILDTDDILATFSALLRIAQIEAGTRKAAFAEIDFTRLVEDVVEAFAPSIQDEDMYLSTHLVGGIRLSGDRELLTQLIANLLENAIRHTPAGTTISVSLAHAAGKTVLSVGDTGPGVPKEVHGRLFDRFFRLDRSRTTSGSGLGLSLVKVIADLHGATIALADNQPGLRVEITFQPLVRRTPS